MSMNTYKCDEISTIEENISFSCKVIVTIFVTILVTSILMTDVNII